MEVYPVYKAFMLCFFAFEIKSCLICDLLLGLPSDTDVIFVSSYGLRGHWAKYIGQTYLKISNRRTISQEGLKSESLTYIVSMSTINETLETVRSISNILDFPPGALNRVNVLVNWPIQLIQEADIEELWENLNIRTTMAPFQIDSRFILIVQLKDMRETTVTLMYQLYVINNVLVHRKLMYDSYNEIMTCGVCNILTHDMDALHRPIRIQDATEGTNSTPAATFEAFTNGSFVQRYVLSLFTAIRDKWNFTLEFVKSGKKDGQKPDGSWQGVVEDVGHGAADVGMSVGIMIKSKAKQVSYLPPLGEDTISAFFLQPDGNAIRDIFVQPFAGSLWLVALLTWLLLAAAMALISIIRQKFCAPLADDREEFEVDQSGDSFIMMLATATQQGWEEHPVAVSLRTILICASIMGVIIYAGYSAAIVSTLSMKTDPITTPLALLHSHLRIGAREDYSKQDWNFHSYDTDNYAALMNRLSTRDSEGLVNGTRALFLIQTQPYAFVSSHVRVYESFREKLSSAGFCKITEMPILKQRLQFGMFTGKTFPLREFLRRNFVVLRERGITWRLRNQFLYVRKCLSGFDNKGHPLGANDVFTAFMLLSVGYLLSIIVLLLEKIAYRKFHNFIN